MSVLELSISAWRSLAIVVIVGSALTASLMAGIAGSPSLASKITFNSTGPASKTLHYEGAVAVVLKPQVDGDYVQVLTNLDMPVPDGW